MENEDVSRAVTLWRLYDDDPTMWRLYRGGYPHKPRTLQIPRVPPGTEAR
ncbi:MAG: hypothetical protein IKQ20_07625 [Bacteroidales bacterium]|nr:hypothetical protein [Bacteroidales bacterium]